MNETNEREEAIQTLQNMIDAECLVVGHMEAEGEEDIDRRPLRALVAGLNALKNSPRKDNTNETRR